MHDDVLLSVQDLTVTYSGAAVPSVRGLSFDLAANETLAIVGESGSGKSTTAVSLVGLLPDGAHTTGVARYGADDLLDVGERRLRQIRGRAIAYVPQNPFGSLNPLFSVGDQIVEAIRAHRASIGSREARDLAIELIETVGIDSPQARFDAYPHQISGGMRQRAVIAMALANRPSLIIADEPTSALDVTVQAQVLEALERARDSVGASLLLITHDLGVVARHADRVLVMYGGTCVESGSVEAVFAHPEMPYTKGLLGAVPRADTSGDQPLIRMAAADGAPPAAGCPFAPRCPAAQDRCRTEQPPLLPRGDGRQAACLRLDEIGALPAAELFGRVDVVPSSPADRASDDGDTPILRVQGLVKHFAVGKRKARATAHAVCEVSFDLRRGETLAVVGESGSGKTTLSRTLVRMVPPTSGSITLDGTEITNLSQRAIRPLRRKIQMVLQDSSASLNPKITVGALIAEPLKIHRRRVRGRVEELLRLVGLPATAQSRMPSELSGGQRQRVAIARALAVEPDVLILDEPVSALDVSVQAEILALLKDLQARLNLAFIFITHDLGVVRNVADRVAVMYLGKVVETGPVEDAFQRPRHPYTQALLSAIPTPDPERERKRTRIVLEGDVPSAQDPPSGCRFRTRCPLFQTLTEQEQQRCISVEPRLANVGASAACHYVDRAVADREGAMGAGV